MKDPYYYRGQPNPNNHYLLDDEPLTVDCYGMGGDNCECDICEQIREHEEYKEVT